VAVVWYSGPLALRSGLNDPDLRRTRGADSNLDGYESLLYPSDNTIVHHRAKQPMNA
jgi:hypothetical protein